MKKLILIVAALAIALPAMVQAKADPNIVVILRGAGVEVDTPTDVLDLAVLGGFLCFETALFDAHTDKVIGTGTDCLEIVASDGPSFSINRVTIFNFPQGRLVANGLTTVVPIFGASSPDSTHVVGDVDDEGPNNIVSGTGKFAGASGDVRLSGAVDLSLFPATMGFNCIFVIDLD